MGIVASICTHRDIQCLPHAVFKKSLIRDKLNLYTCADSNSNTTKIPKWTEAESNGQKLTKKDRNELKRTVTDKKGQKRTATDRNDQSGQKKTETTEADRNRQGRNGRRPLEKISNNDTTHRHYKL